MTLQITFRIQPCNETMMKDEYQSTARNFLEIASEQRLAILLKLFNQNSKVSVIAKELGATVPEVYRNFERLSKADLICKELDGNYGITPFGKIVCSQIPSITFLSDNKRYFKTHDFGDLPDKFLDRIGSLEGGRHIKSFVKVLEKWKELYENAEEYICNVLFEVPYTPDLIDTLAKKITGDVTLRSILSQQAIVPKERREIFDKQGFKKFIEEQKIERKMLSSVKVVVILNEKEALVMFPRLDGEVDLSEGFFSNEQKFQEWALDYFNYCWEKAGAFREVKLKAD